MKKLLLLSTSFLLLSVSNAQIVSMLNENFNNGFPAGWSRIDMDGNTPHTAVSFAGNSFSTHIDFDTTGTGDSILVSTSWFSPAGVASNYLITPQITLQANGNQLIWQVMSKDPSFPEAYEVLISTTLPVVDSFHVEDTLYTTILEYPYWTEYTLELDQYAGQTIYLAFHHSSNDKFLLCLDNIRVIADLQAGTGEIPSVQQLVKVFPNPANNFINISTPGVNPETCEIIDLSGKLVLSVPVSSNNETVSVADLNPGIYFVRITADGHYFFARFIRSGE